MKKKITFISTVILFSRISCFSQDTARDFSQLRQNMRYRQQHFVIKDRVDIPLVIGGAAFSAYNFSRISKKSSTPVSVLEALHKGDVNWFDRWGVRKYSKSIDNASYIPFYVAMPYPIIFFALDNKMRKDFFKLTFLYAEAIIITGVFYSSAAGYVNRYRPFVYNSETPLDKRSASDSKKSFFAGHVALVSTSTFFMARVYADYHPDSHFKWLAYGAASAATVATAYMRQAAGEHFLSDILLGTTIGTLSGILTPELHQNKLLKNQRLSIYPLSDQGKGFTAIYRL
ncbi:MAG TPA: phosphatase PAP2 family protein [Chitinophagaceae bacterium]|nr:phosphatase PAP2 family protein [Chitinophagaceae bacterium]